MKVYDNSDSVLIEVQTLSRNGNQLEFTGVVMGAMPVQGKLSPQEARKAFGLIKGLGLWWFILTFIFRKNANQGND